MMDELLLRIAEEERLDYFFRLDREVVESKLYHFMRRFVDKYNSLPPLAECQKHTTGLLGSIRILLGTAPKREAG